ncbi:hypothetical protein [Pseudonocardia sp.]|jgi:hypothetical protein|uniref:hypothetical protein n=1 Tax=Pseudonocardia sp. TaxID=60912 RepID=UPI002609E92A|nr:hypothetical protein [Pseudonocardia sp.]MCW2720110.1 hypothetical protein [Pseudonocardia sp.]
MNPRYAFRPTDLTTLLDLAEPADQAIQDILLRRSAIDITEPPQESKRAHSRPTLQLVPDLTPRDSPTPRPLTRRGRLCSGSARPTPEPRGDRMTMAVLRDATHWNKALTLSLKHCRRRLLLAFRSALRE